MEDWAAKFGVWVNNKVDFFSPSAPPLLGCGARARSRIGKGDLLLQIPLRACLLPEAWLPAGAPDWLDEQQKLLEAAITAMKEDPYYRQNVYRKLLGVKKKNEEY